MTRRRRQRWLLPSGDRPRRRIRRRSDKRERGVALLMAITIVAIMTVVITDMHESTSTAYAIAVNQRDRVKAEYMAKSGLNLTRLIIAREPQIRQVIAPLYQAMLGHPPPMLPVWRFSSMLLKPFCDYESTRGMNTGFDLQNATGLGATDSMCEVNSFAENSKINVNMPLNFSDERAKRLMAMQLFALMGGYQSPSPYDPIFSNRDRDGQFTSRLDVVAALIDWWDFDTNRTGFDPGAAEVSSVGAEDDIYQRLEDRYEPKNAPYDSLEELRLVRGVSDDFWATFIEPRPDAPEDRTVTIYGSGLVNVNEAPPEVLLARSCSFMTDQPLCANPLEQQKFVTLLNTVRGLVPVPFFQHSRQFVEFLEGRGGARGLYPMLQAFLGGDPTLMFTPVTIPQESRQELTNTFVTAARIIAINSTGRAGCREREEDSGICLAWRSETRLETIMNFHDRWTPPPPNAGTMPGLGIFHYYRAE